VIFWNQNNKKSTIPFLFRNHFVFLQRIQIIAIMEVAINSQLYQQASTYAQQQRLNITSVIENFLMRFVGAGKNATEQAVPDVVQSLLGAGEKVADDDLNAREAYYEYLEEKYK
jgi:hypothetical protein